jgi:hypothetical protein
MFADRYAFADTEESAIRALEMRHRIAERRRQISE